MEVTDQEFKDYNKKMEKITREEYEEEIKKIKKMEKIAREEFKEEMEKIENLTREEFEEMEKKRKKRNQREIKLAIIYLLIGVSILICIVMIDNDIIRIILFIFFFVCILLEDSHG